MNSVEDARWVAEQRRDPTGAYWALRSMNGPILVSMVAGYRPGVEDVHYDFRINDPELAQRCGLYPGEFTLDFREARDSNAPNGCYMNREEVSAFLTRLGLGKKRPHFKEMGEKILVDILLSYFVIDLLANRGVMGKHEDLFVLKK